MAIRKKIFITLFLFTLLIITIMSLDKNFDKATAQNYSAKVTTTYSKAENLIELGKYNEAYSYINSLLEKNPNDLQAKLYLAEVYSSQFKLDAAEREFLKILQKYPKNASAYNGLGLVYYRRTASSDMSFRGNAEEYYNKALKQFSLAVKYDPNYYKAYDNAGKILFEAGRLNDAAKYFQKALEIRPDYSEAKENYGRVLFAKNQTDAAIAAYKEALRLNSKNASAYYNLGEALIRKGNYSEAVKHLQTSLYLFANSAGVHDLLGKAYEMQGNEAAAISEYKKSFLIKPEYLPPYLRLAQIYRNRGDDEIALSELKNALAVNPEFYEAKLKIAEISLNSGKTEQAIKYCMEVLILNLPKYREEALILLSKAYFNRAIDLSSRQAFASESEYVEIEKALNESIKYSPDNMELYLALLRVSKLANNDEKSAVYLKNIVQNTSNSKINLVIKGEAYMIDKDFGSAEREFLNALNQAADKDEILQLADIYTMNRAYVSARHAVNKALSLAPNDIKAKRVLERLKKNYNQSVLRLRAAEEFYRDGHKEAAAEAYLDAIELNAYLPEAHLGLARFFDRENYYYDAIEHYKAYINLIDISKIDEKNKYSARIELLRKKIASLEAKNKTVKRY